jgi:hypothetical protein
MTSSRRDRRAVRAALLLALGVLAGCAAPVPPEFESKEHKFRVRFGAPPRVIDQPDGPARTQLFTVEHATGAYTVRAYELEVPADVAARAADKLLDDAKADLLRSVGGAQTEGRSVVLAGKYPGRAFTATATGPKPGVLRGRVYLAGARLYKVSVFGTAEFASAPDATAFLDSFAVTE